MYFLAWTMTDLLIPQFIFVKICAFCVIVNCLYVGSLYLCKVFVFVFCLCLFSLLCKQMGETIASNPTLQVSVSFGRFENDSLSWEKWSAFSPN